MSLNTSIRKATRSALKAMESIAENVTYHQVTGNPVYDADAGSFTRNTAPTTIKGWLTSFEERHVDGDNVQPGDKRLTFEVISTSIVPKMNDFVVDEAGDEWEVINIKLPPPKILYILHVRRP